MLAQIVWQIRRGGLFDKLLVIALQRTVPVAEMHQVAMRVAQHLHLDMAGAERIAFQKYRRIAERTLRLCPGRGDGLGRVGHVGDETHPASATAGAGLDQEWHPKRARLLQQA